MGYRGMVLLLMLSLPPIARAQEALPLLPDSLRQMESEMLASPESEAEVLAKCRRFLAAELRQGNLDRIRAAAAYIQYRFDNENWVAFDDDERLLLSYWTGNTRAVLDYALPQETQPDSLVRHYRQYQYRKRHHWQVEMRFLEHDSLSQILMTESVANQLSLRAALNTSSLAAADKAFLELFLEFLLVKKVDSDYRLVSRSQAAVNAKAEAYLAAYPESPYCDFTRNVIRIVYRTGDWGFGYDISLGALFPNDKFSPYFKSSVLVGFGAEVTYQDWVVTARINTGSNVRTKIPFSYDGDWRQDLHLTVFLPELSFGVNVVDNSLLKVMPFLGLNMVDIEPQSKVKEEEGLDLRLLQVGGTLGLNLDFKIRDGQEISPKTENYYSLRFRASYTQAGGVDAFAGSLVSVSVSFGGFFRAAVRED